MKIDTTNHDCIADAIVKEGVNMQIPNTIFILEVSPLFVLYKIKTDKAQTLFTKMKRMISSYLLFVLIIVISLPLIVIADKRL